MTLQILRQQGLHCYTMDLVNAREKKWEQEEIIKAPCALKFLAEGMGSERVTDEWRQTQKEGGTVDKEGRAGRYHCSRLIGKVVYM